MNRAYVAIAIAALGLPILNLASRVPQGTAAQPRTFPSLGDSDHTITARIRTSSGGVVFSLSAESGPWAGGGKAYVVREGRLGCDFANVGIWLGRSHVADGRWHRVAWTYSDTRRVLRFYVDGAQDGEAPVKCIPDIPGDILRIGRAASGITPPNGFVGAIDEVRVFARELTPEEIAADSAEDAVAWWPLNGDARDVSGNGRDGTMVETAPGPSDSGGCLEFSGTSVVDIVRPCARLLARMQHVRPGALSEALTDLIRTYPDRYQNGPRLLRQAAEMERALPQVLQGLERDDANAAKEADRYLQFQREVLLNAPGLDFDTILAIRRSVANLGLPANWESNSSLPRTGFDNEIVAVQQWRGRARLETVFRPASGQFVGDMDLHFDGTRMLVSMPGANGRWQVHEISLSGHGETLTASARELALISDLDVDNYDACYLPDGGVIFGSTAPMVGVPCVTGTAHVSNLYRWKPDGSIRRLTFEQDHDWCPTVMEDGRILYLRWEYSDLPHFVSRILFTMNPDGTGQTAYYGSNSYWPNSMFYARPIPGSTSRFVAVVSGHHDVPRMGELVLFDTLRGTHEADGAVQRIPGRGKRVEPVILDGLVKDKWPKFLHPWPIDRNRLLVSAQLSPGGRWGMYLADAFDNLVLIADLPGYALFEPVPLKARPVPPVIPDRVLTDRKEALVGITDIYAGDGLRGVPRGTVKSLRLLSYHFAYHNVGGQVHRVGLDGPWDIKRILGTVPVRKDGSAYFRIPANTPISLQPLDANGRALQLMRSWMTAMPAERVTCAGCHERPSEASRNRSFVRPSGLPDDIRPWYGPPRGFSFRREVQPVLDRHCVSCHGAGSSLDLRDSPDVRPSGRDPNYNDAAHFPRSYLALRAYVRGHTIESDMHLLPPGEFHASTTRLIRILEKGHHGVRLDREAWDRLNTWIDLNTPAHGTWGEIVGPDYVARQRQRRIELDTRYASVTVDGEAIIHGTPYRPARTEAAPKPGYAVFSSRHGARLIARNAALRPDRRPPLTVDLGGGVRMNLVWVPPGRFIMGDAHGLPDERPTSSMEIERGFYMAVCETTNAQYARFDPRHDSGLEVGDFLQFSIEERGYPVNGPSQPVCRVSLRDAMAFCRWLSRRTGRTFTLPSEAQWEYACRAGTSTPLWWGSVESDFSRCANLADARLRHVDTFALWSLPSGAIPPWRPAVERVDDGHRVSAPVGSFRPNPFRLHDMHGNVSEWTCSPYRPYPFQHNGPLIGAPSRDRFVVRGGSWYDLPREARSAHRLAYEAWRRVFDVGFRVIGY